MYRLCILCASALLMNLVLGCASTAVLVPSQLYLEKDSMTAVTAGLSQTFFRSKQSGYRICSQPMPDAAFDQSEGGSVSVSMIGTGSESGSEDEGSTDAEMAGRTPAVLIAREMFYRACEFSTNFDLSEDQATQLYLKTLDAVSQGWAIEAGQTTVTIGDTVVDTSEDKADDSLTTSQTATDTQTSTTKDMATETEPSTSTTLSARFLVLGYG